jgi:glutamate-1-semialdehyde aminotransferase
VEFAEKGKEAITSIIRLTRSASDRDVFVSVARIKPEGAYRVG